MISDPVLILIVGSAGLASNLGGFFVLGGHGHSHGPGEHSHGDETTLAEEGHNHVDHDHIEDDVPIFPEAVVAKAKSKSGNRLRFSSEDDDTSTARDSTSTLNKPWVRGSPRNKHRRRTSRTSGRFSSIDDISIHPASFRQDIIAASKPQLEGIESESSTASEEEAVADDDDQPTENTALLRGQNGHSHGSSSEHNRNGSGHSHVPKKRHDSWHVKHNHNKPKKESKGGHGHDHGDMGMNAMILHVIGDALGNVGVIVSALIIWLTNWSGRFYADPAVSLFITLIILKSALPLTKATAKILLQATPDHLDVTDIKQDIQDIPGVISCHHVHIWQLSDTQIVASMHIQVSFPISEASGDRYMELAKNARACLHAYGIHSATIQPEFCLDKDHDHFEGQMGLDGIVGQARCRLDDDCLLECVDDCKAKGCCAPSTVEDQHDHSEHDGHTH